MPLHYVIDWPSWSAHGKKRPTGPRGKVPARDLFSTPRPIRCPCHTRWKRTLATLWFLQQPLLLAAKGELRPHSENLGSPNVAILSWANSLSFFWGGGGWRPLSRQREAHRYLKNRLGIFRARVGFLDHPYAPLAISSSHRDAHGSQLVRYYHPRKDLTLYFFYRIVCLIPCLIGQTILINQTILPITSLSRLSSSLCDCMYFYLESSACPWL